MGAENKEVNTALQEEYNKEFTPQVHRVARWTHIIAVLIMFACPAYLYFIRGYQDVPISSYIAVIVLFLGACGHNWISSPISYWPMLGSASAYMGYLSGNGNNMKVPVAIQCANAMNVDVLTPRGQIISIVGVVASNFCAELVLLCVIFFGKWILSVLPAPVVASFSFLLCAMFAFLLGQRIEISGKGNAAKGVLSEWPVLVTAGGCWYLFNKVIKLGNYSMIVALLCCMVVSLLKYIITSKKEG